MKIRPTQQITDKEGYDALLYFLKHYLEISGSNDLTDILSGAEYMWDTDEPADIAFWYYWQEAIDKVKNQGEFPIKELTNSNL